MSPQVFDGCCKEVSSKSDAGLPERTLLHSTAFIVIVALLLRLAVITIGHTYRFTPRQEHFQFGWEMGRIARSIAQGHGYASPLLGAATGPTAWAPPVYPYILAGVFKLFGVYTAASAWIILAINSIFSALTCLTVYRIGARLMGTTPARWAAWTWALFPYEVYWPSRVVWETCLSAFLLSLALLLALCLDDPDPGERSLRAAPAEAKLQNWLGFGLLWGVIALTNTTMMSFLPFSLLWIWWRTKRRGVTMVNATAAMLVCAAVIAPWLVRNQRTFGHVFFIRDNLGLEMQVANNDVSKGFWGRSEHPSNDPAQLRRYLELGELGYMQEKQQQANDWIRAHPLTFVYFATRRAVYFWIGKPQDTQLGNLNMVPARHIAFGLSAIGAFAGLFLAWRNRIHGTFLFAALVLVFPLPYCLAHPAPRYRNAIEPEIVLLIVYALYLARGKSVRWPGKLKLQEESAVQL